MRPLARTDRLLGAGVVAAAAGGLLARIAPDVRGKPLYEDEAVAGLIGARPLRELLDTVMLDRGGAPLHFVLAHAVFQFDTSAEALRWLSVACAIAAVPVCFDLGWLLGGTAAGVVAAVVVASSTALGVYGSFGRMYALFVLVAAVAADLFVRAVRLRSLGAVLAAALGAWLLPAVHPYGAIPALAELAVAAVLWRRRSLRIALPVAVIAGAAVPFLLADVTLADRAQVGSGEAFASPGDAWNQLVAALSAFAGGDGLPLLAFTALALVGLAVLARREPGAVVLAAAVAVPPLAFLVLRAGSAPDLSPRHLFYALPLWAASIGVGTAWLVRGLPSAAGAVAIAAIALAAVASPRSALRDPRELGLLPTEVPGSAHAERGDLIFPYATPFLADLEHVRHAVPLPQGPGDLILDALDHAEEPIPRVVLAMPEERRWRVVRLDGPFDKANAIFRAAEAYGLSRHPAQLEWWYRLVERGLCDAVADLGPRCPS